MQTGVKRVLYELLVGVVGKPLDGLRNAVVTGPKVPCGSRGQSLELGKFVKIQYFRAPFKVLCQRPIGELLKLVR